MATTESDPDRVSKLKPDRDSRPEISVCESSPGKVVLIESDNTEGWIASDQTVDVIR